MRTLYVQRQKALLAWKHHDLHLAGNDRNCWNSNQLSFIFINNASANISRTFLVCFCFSSSRTVSRRRQISIDSLAEESSRRLQWFLTDMSWRVLPFRCCFLLSGNTGSFSSLLLDQWSSWYCLCLWIPETSWISLNCKPFCFFASTLVCDESLKTTLSLVMWR